jgi:glycosyltransferase involved in cell wall biosynthesis
MFIPLKITHYNETSENYNKFLEAGVFKIPVVVANIFPYNTIIKDGENGIILNKKADLIDKIEYFMSKSNKDELKKIGENAENTVLQNYLITSEQNMLILDAIYSN